MHQRPERPTLASGDREAGGYEVASHAGNQAPPQTSPVSPSNGARLKTVTPTLAVNPVADPEGDEVRYRFKITTKPDAETGTVLADVSIASTSFTVPEGALKDGVTYFWHTYTSDATHPSGTLPPWVSSFSVDLGLGVRSTMPFDGAGPVQVNLTNGNAVVSTSSPSLATVAGPLAMSYTFNSQTPSVLSGLIGTYIADGNANREVDSGENAAIVRRDTTLAFDWAGGAAAPGLPSDNVIVRWSGYVTSPLAGQFAFGASASDGVRIRVNNQLLLDRWSSGSTSTPEYGTSVTLAADSPVPITVEWFDAAGNAHLRVYVKGVGATALAEALVPTSWLSAEAPGLPRGWTFAPVGGSGLAYLRAEVSDSKVVLVGPDGDTHVYTSNGTGYTPPVNEDGVLTRDGTGRLTMHATDGRTYVFDAAGTLQSSVSSSDNPAAHQYVWTTPSGSSLPRLTGITDPVSQRTVIVRYGGDSGCPATVPPGFDSAAPSGMLCQIDFWDGRVTKLFYVGGRLGRLEDPGAEITDFGYDAEGRITRIRDSLAADFVAAALRADDDTTRTVITYDASGRATAVALPQPTAGAPAPGHTYEFTSPTQTRVRVAGLVEPLGFARKVTFDDTGRTLSETEGTNRTSTMEWNAADQPVATVDPAGLKTTTVYDWAGRPTETYGPAPAAWFGADNKPLADKLSAVPRSTIGYDESMRGLDVMYFDNDQLAGAPVGHTMGVNADGSVFGEWAVGPPIPGITTNVWSARMTGEIFFPAVGSYTIAPNAGGSAKVFIDDLLVVDTATATSGTYNNQVADSRHRVRIEYKAPSSPNAAKSKSFSLAGGAQSWTVPAQVTSVTVEAWGGQGGKGGGWAQYAPVGVGGLGGYARATMAVSPGEVFQVTVGGAGQDGWTFGSNTTASQASGGFNGGGAGNAGNNGLYGGGGGGRTEVWRGSERVVVAGGGGGGGAAPQPLLEPTAGGTGGTGGGDAGGRGWWGTATQSGGIGGNQVQPGWAVCAEDGTAGTGGQGGRGCTHGGGGGGGGYFGGGGGPGETSFATGGGGGGSGYLTPTGTNTTMTNGTRTGNGQVTLGWYEPGPHGIDLHWTPPSGASQRIPGSRIAPRYGLTTSAVDPDGRRSVTEYASPELGLPTATVADPSGLNLRSTVTYEAAGVGFRRRLSRTLPKGAATTISYAHYAATETAANPCDPTAPPANQAGLPKQTTSADPDGGDSQAPIVREVVHDTAGRAIASRVASDAGWSCLTYDDRDRVVSSRDRAGGISAVSYAVPGAVVQTFPDSAGATRTTEQEMDLLGRPVAYTDEAGTRTRMVYDQAGRVVATHRRLSGSTETLLTSSTFDAAGRPLTTSDHLTGVVRTTTFTYDAAGRLQRTQRPNGYTTVNTLDDLGRLHRLEHLSTADAATQQSFSFTGGSQSWTVPAQVTSVTLEAWGGQGGSGSGIGASPGAGGLGGYAKVTVAVTPGEVLQVVAAGAGGSAAWPGTQGAGGFGGGGNTSGQGFAGGGGGASAVWRGGERLVTAGGGGGGGGTGSNVIPEIAGGAGGAGGGVEGGRGWTAGSQSGGGGGTQTTGGIYSCETAYGSADQGGTGCPPASGQGGGGGGGGGLYGGAGGWASASGHLYSAGGGGGSGYVTPTGTNPTMTNGTRTGNGQVTLTWTAPAAPTTTRSYSLAGRVVAETVGAVTRQYSYDGAGRLTTTVDGATTRRYAYDANTNRCGLAATCDGAWSYDDADRVTSSPYASSYEYDDHGNVVSAVLTGPTAGQDLEDEFAFDAATSASPRSYQLRAGRDGVLTATAAWTPAVYASDVVAGQLDPSGSTSLPLAVNGESRVVASTVWSQGTRINSAAFGGSLPTGGSSSHAFTTTKPGTITASLDWAVTDVPFSQSGSVGVGNPSNPVSVDYPITVKGNGTIAMDLQWQSSPLSPNLDLELYDHTMTKVAESSEVFGTSESISHAVTGMTYPSARTYTLRVRTVSVDTSFDLTGSYPQTADVDVELRRAGEVVASSSTTTAKPETLTYAADPGDYTLTAVSKDLAVPGYTIAATYPVAAHADLTLRLKDPSGQVVTQQRAATGTVAIDHQTAAGGTHTLELVNHSTGVDVPSWTTDWTLHSELSIELRDSTGTVIADGSGTGTARTVTTQVTPGDYTLAVTPTAGAGTATVTAATPGDRLTINYDAHDHATVVDDGTTTVTETLAPSGRVLRRVVTTNATGAVEEDITYSYSGPGDSPAHSQPTAGGPITTYLGGMIDVGGTPKWLVANAHGDIIGTATATGAFTPAPTTDEFGVGGTTTDRLGWLGAHHRPSIGGDLGLIRMGVRLYDPALGRFLQVDPVEGGSCNDYDYVCGDPVNAFDLDGQAMTAKEFLEWVSRQGEAAKAQLKAAADALEARVKNAQPFTIRNARPAIHWSDRGRTHQHRIEYDPRNKWHYNPPGGGHQPWWRGVIPAIGAAARSIGGALGRGTGPSLPIFIPSNLFGCSERRWAHCSSNQVA